MESPNSHIIPLLLIFLHVFWFTPKASQALTKQTPSTTNTVSALLVFGDSTVDPGNNNYVQTLFKSNFQPYGRDFINQRPTGRFTNGRLSTDYIASYMGIKEFVPPYLDPSLSIKEMMTGVSFASAGSGFDPLTSGLSNVIPIQKQLEYFKEYKKRLESAIGKQQAESHIEKAIFIISAGTNDFVVNYFTLPVRRKTYTVSNYQQFIIQNLKDFVQSLWAEGARRFGVVGLPPMGCLPIVITLNSENAILRRGCIEYYSSVATNYNQILQSQLHLMHNALSLSGGRIYYIDVYGPLMEMIQGQTNFGFDDVNSGCCGTGYLEASFMCNPKSFACPDASKYVFWDSIHPTQTAYYIVFKAVRHVLDLLIKN
ncbi:GDSL esterase/lipase At5g45960 [Ziziphus jujuba]|uniref:GDSL esterase/lipase At5g45960 n=1 Tax=Ziziphus jujuba TaxID=326968 RepID=A0ABM3ID73_ZIZJJ|nr:GDSL esterase/lipase At5g45960 [Ziziphus jujuba]